MKSATSKRRYARIPVAVALGALCLGATSMAAAEVTNNIYGNFRYSFNYVDTATIDSNIQADNNASRLGFRGEVSGTDLTAFYHLEGGVDVDNPAFTGRFYYAGVRGGFGSAVIGRHSPAYKMGGVGVNPFHDVGAASVSGTYGPTGASFGLSDLTNGYANNTLAYTSPKLGPVTVNAAVYFDDTEADDHHYGVGVAYAEGPITAGFQYYDAEGAGVWGNAVRDAQPQVPARGTDKAYRAHGSFTTGPIKLGLSYENVEDQAGNDVNYYFVAGTFSLSSDTRISASVGYVDETNANLGANEGIGGNIGMFHNLLPNTTVYALYSKVDFDDNTDDTDIVSVGFVYNFNSKL